jgi:hypothetical protein
MKAFLGDYVITKTHRHMGRVYKKYNAFYETHEHTKDGGKDTSSWFGGQKPKLSKRTLDKPWYSILCKDGGAVLVPESELAAIQEPYALGNEYYGEFHFGDQYRKVRDSKPTDLPLLIGEITNNDAKALLVKRMGGK